MRCSIEYSRPAIDHLRRLSTRDQPTIVDGVERSLGAEPTVETRHRKRMRPNPIAPWELRVGDFRVYYDVQERKGAEDASVEVLAIGRKDRNRVIIGGKEMNL